MKDNRKIKSFNEHSEEKLDKFLIVFEDGSIYRTTEITDDDKQNVFDGIISIINTEIYKQLDIEGNWSDIDKWEG